MRDHSVNHPAVMATAIFVLCLTIVFITCPIGVDATSEAIDVMCPDGICEIDMSESSMVSMDVGSGHDDHRSSGTLSDRLSDSTLALDAAPLGTTADFEYDLINNDTEVRITGYTGSGGDVTIPDVIEGKSVTVIGDYAFFFNNLLTSVTIGDSVTTIGDEAFYECNSLTSATIGDNVTTIGFRAFYQCDSLTSVTMGESIITIGSSAFHFCTSLTSVTISDSVITIGSSAFESCTSLTSVTIGDSVTTIGFRAFKDCTSLTSVTIGDDVMTIEDEAFEFCTSLTSVTFPDNVTTIGNFSFVDCTSLTSVTIGDNVTTIGIRAFYRCSSLTSVTIPDNVTTIGGEAFRYCTSLTSVTIGDNVISIEPGAFCECTLLTSVTIGDSVTTIGNYAFESCTSLTSVTMGNSVTTIGSRAFHGCTSLPSVTIGKNVTTIGEYALLGCSALTSIDVDVNNTVYASIDGILYNKMVMTLIQCPGGRVGDVTICDCVITIGDHAFAQCSSLTSVTIGDDVMTIGDNAFSSSPALTSITFDGDAPSIGGDWASDHNESLTVYFYKGSVGFSTPEWQGLPCACLCVPDAPQDMVTYSGPGYVNITWSAPFDGNSTIERYDVYRDGTLLTNVTTPWYNDTTVVAGDHYMYVVTAVNAVGAGAASSYVSGDTVPAFPGDLIADSRPGHVDLTWSAPSDGGSTITRYDVYRDGSLLGDSTTPWYNDTTVVAGEDYTYNVTAVNIVGTSAVSSDVIGNTVPAAPGDLVTSSQPGHVNITWSEPSDGGSSIIIYIVQRDDAIAFATMDAWFEDDMVVAGCEHVYHVTAVNSVGEGEASSVVIGSTVPAAPSGLQVVAGPGWNNVSWLMPADGGSSVTHFNVSTETSVEVMALEVLYHVGDRWYYNITDVIPGTQCNYTVSAMNAVGWSDVSDSVMGTSIPTAPCDLTADAVDTRVTLTWKVPTDGGSTIGHYRVCCNGTFMEDVMSTYYIDDTVDAYVWYGYSVTAVNAVGEGPSSTVDVFVPDETAPTVNIMSPFDGAVIASNDVTVTWTANDTGSGLASFNVTVDDVFYELNASTFSLALTLDEGSHVVVVTAYDVAGNHANSSVEFTVAIKPTVVDHSPTGDDVSGEASLVITFSEVMDQDSVTVTCDSVTLTPSWSGNVVTLTHDAFDANMTYDVVVYGNDTHGNAMDEYTWTFTTENVVIVNVTITGIVSNGDGPVVNATVTLDTGDTTTTDLEGRYSLTTTPGEHTITVSKDGFDTVSQTVTVTGADVQTFDETLNPTTSSSMLWVGVIVALAVVAAIALVVYRRR